MGNWFRGRVARQSSAKARTAVRIRSEPQTKTIQIRINEERVAEWFFWFLLVLTLLLLHHKLGKITGLIRIRINKNVAINN